MWNTIKTELYKSIHNRWFAIALLLAFIVQLFSFFPNLDFVKQAMEFAESNLELISPNWRGSNDQMNMYVMWLSEEGYTMGFTLASYMLLILAVLPFGWLCALIGEHGAPLPYTMTTSVVHGNVASELYYTKPMLAAIIWTLISSLWGGALAGLTIPASRFFKRSIFVLLTPFFITVLEDNICTIVLNKGKFSFMNNIFLCGSYSGDIVFSEIAILIALGLAVGLIDYARTEVL